LCVWAQLSWAWTCSYDGMPPPLPPINDMAWHVITVRPDNEVDKIVKITAIKVSTVHYGKETPGFSPDIQDLDCNKTDFTKRDYCRFRLRLPGIQASTADGEIETYFTDPDKDELSLCSQRYSLEKNGFSPVLRFAKAEEYNGFPALKSSYDNRYAVLVVENGNTKEIKISEIKNIHAPWLNLIHKSSDSDELYGRNAECSAKKDTWTVNKLEHVSDSCILVYDLANVAPTADKPRIEINMLAGIIPHTEVINIDQVLKPMELRVSYIDDVGITDILNLGYVRNNTLTLTNYYSYEEAVKPKIEIYNSGAERMNEDYFEIEYGRDGCVPSLGRDCKSCYLTGEFPRCTFRIIAKREETSGSGVYNEYKAPAGLYAVKISYKDIIIESSFHVLAPEVIAKRIKDRRKFNVDD